MFSIRELFNLYNERQTVTHRPCSILKHIVVTDFGSALKKCFIGNRLNTLPVEEKNCLLTQELKKIIITQKYNANNTSDDDWKGIPDHIDIFLNKKLEEKLGEYFQLFNAARNKLRFKKTIKFSEFQSVAQELLEECNNEKKELVIEKARVLENIAYPLTEKYFLFRYLAKAIICTEDSISLTQNSYQEEKGLCLIFSSELKALTEFSGIQSARERFNSERKHVDRLLRVSDKANNHSGKIAAIYVTYIAAMTCARYIKEDEHDRAWYQLVTLPSAILAMLQIAISFPQIIYSTEKAKDIRNYIFESQDGTHNIGTSGIKIDDVQFLDQNIPIFSNDEVYKYACIFRWLGNLILQPIDLIQDNTKDLILRWSAMRWFTPTGVIEEQSKVASFVNCGLRNFVYNYILLVTDHNKPANNRYVDRVFYLLYEKIEEGKREDLERIYEALTGKKNINFENIVSYEEKKQISRHQMWLKAAYVAGVFALIAEYVCFSCRNQNINWYEDPVFYCATVVKFMHLGSLLLSKHYGNKIIEYLTGNRLDSNVSFQDFFYNDTARMAADVIPLIMFESTEDIKILGIANAIDVLTTVRSDANSGKALSQLNQISIEKLTAVLNKANYHEM